MTTELDRATALQRDTPGRFHATIDPLWFVQTGPNGGYVAALLTRAMVAAVDDPGRPARSLTVHYLQPAVAGAATLEVDVLRAGRSMSFLAVRLLQDGRLVATGSAAFGTGRSDLVFQDVHPPPDLPRADDLEPPPTPPFLSPPIADRIDYRPTQPAELFSGGAAEFWCWLRLRDRAPVDAAALALYVDAMIPTLFIRATTPVLVPTIDLTVHFRASPRPGYDGWCLGHVRTRTVVEGFAEEDCDIYDDAGVLLAQSRQLGLVVPLG
jgi:acyl-CoA thioesterase